MPQAAGLVKYFPKLEGVTGELLLTGPKSRLNPQILENKLGNVLLYPSAVPYSKDDSDFMLALVRAALRLWPENFFNRNLKTVYIPEEMLLQVPDLAKLSWVFVEALSVPEIAFLYLKSAGFGLKNLGTFLKPEVAAGRGQILLWVDGKKFTVSTGQATVIPAPGTKVDIRLQSSAAKLLGKEDTTTELVGGPLGLLVDAR